MPWETSYNKKSSIPPLDRLPPPHSCSCGPAAAPTLAAHLRQVVGSAAISAWAGGAAWRPLAGRRSAVGPWAAGQGAMAGTAAPPAPPALQLMALVGTLLNEATATAGGRQVLPRGGYSAACVVDAFAAVQALMQAATAAAPCSTDPSTCAAAQGLGSCLDRFAASIASEDAEQRFPPDACLAPACQQLHQDWGSAAAAGGRRFLVGWQQEAEWLDECSSLILFSDAECQWRQCITQSAPLLLPGTGCSALVSLTQQTAARLRARAAPLLAPWRDWRLDVRLRCPQDCADCAAVQVGFNAQCGMPHASVAAACCSVALGPSGRVAPHLPLVSPPRSGVPGGPWAAEPAVPAHSRAAQAR